MAAVELRVPVRAGLRVAVQAALHAAHLHYHAPIPFSPQSHDRTIQTPAVRDVRRQPRDVRRQPLHVAAAVLPAQAVLLLADAFQAGGHQVVLLPVAQPRAVLVLAASLAAVPAAELCPLLCSQQERFPGSHGKDWM